MTRVVPLTTDRFRSTLDGADSRVRELMAVREIAHAFLTAERPEQVYQLALERISPLVGASLACVYLRDGSTETLRLAAAHNWPARYAPFLQQMRVRVGSGPSGEAVSERRTVEVPDVFADRQLTEWQEVARELGFRSLVAVPLEAGEAVLGALAFYFSAAGSISPDTRALLRIVGDQMAATAEKAGLIADLKTSNAALIESNATLERQYATVVEARRIKDEFLANISHELRTPLTAVVGYVALMEEGAAGPLTEEQLRTLGDVRAASDRLLGLVGDLLELTALNGGMSSVAVAEFDARAPLRDAVGRLGARPAAVSLTIDEPSDEIRMASDHRKVARILSALLDNAFKFTSEGAVRVEMGVAGDRVTYQVHDTGIGIPLDAQDFVFDEFRQVDGTLTRRFGGSGLGLALARRLARLLGGEISVISSPGSGSTFRVELPLAVPMSTPPGGPAAPSRAGTS